MRVSEKECLRRILRGNEGESNKEVCGSCMKTATTNCTVQKNFWVNKLKRMRLMGNVGYMKLTKHTYKDLVWIRKTN